MKTAIEDLKFWETTYCMAVCNVNYRGNLKSVADKVDDLRAETGMRYDAINGKLYSDKNPAGGGV